MARLPRCLVLQNVMLGLVEESSPAEGNIVPCNASYLKRSEIVKTRGDR